MTGQLGGGWLGLAGLGELAANGTPASHLNETEETEESHDARIKT
jgi:hypothetical protein